jgi:hypothetical protein
VPRHRVLTDEERWLRTKTEAEFSQEIIDAAEVGGWLWYHTHDSRRSPKGFPDLTLVRGHELIFLEVKKQTGVVTPEQQEWIDRLSSVESSSTISPRPGVVAMVVRPSDATAVFDMLAPRRLHG